MFEALRLPERPPMTSADYLEAVQLAGRVVRAARPWLLVAYDTELVVATRRTRLMAWVVWVVNLYRRPRRWWLHRARAAYYARQTKRGNRNV